MTKTRSRSTTTARARRPARSTSGASRSPKAPAAFDVAKVKARLVAIAPVPYTAAVRRIERRRGIHPRRLIPRVPTGKWQADVDPTPQIEEQRQEMAAAGGGAPMAATDDLVLVSNAQLSDVATADTASHVCEPSVAVNGDVVFFTGNWFASISTDRGQTFRFVDPETSFPDPPGMRFCCDQVAHYIKKIDTFVWLLQYTEDNQGNNVQRLAFATTAQIRQGQWRIFDISSPSVGLPGVFLDYPDLAVGTNMLYLTMNGFRGNGWDSTILVRLPLSGIKTGNITADRFIWRQNFNFRVAQHCGTSAYFASHNTSSQIRVFRWRESAPSPDFADVDVATWEEGNIVSMTPDGFNWLERCDPRMTGATLANGVLWFSWTSQRGGANNRPHPFVQIARVKASTRTLVSNVNLWDPNAAIAYAALSTNSNGEVGTSYAIGGGARFPSHVVGLLTGTRREAVTFTGARGPADGKWGDYLTVRRAYPKQKLFAATGYTLQAGAGASDATPSFTIFGRSSDV
jgi:hypothetical protein